MAEKLERLQRNFPWSGTEDITKWNLINWETICKPKNKRGLGIRRISYMNKALLTKMGGNWWKKTLAGEES